MTDDELSAACLLRDATDDCGSCFVRSWGGEYEVNVQPDTVVRWHRAGFRFTGAGSRVAGRAVPGLYRGLPIDPGEH